MTENWRDTRELKDQGCSCSDVSRARGFLLSVLGLGVEPRSAAENGEENSNLFSRGDL